MPFTRRTVRARARRCAPTHRTRRLFKAGEGTARLLTTTAAEVCSGAPDLTLHRADLRAVFQGALPDGLRHLARRLSGIDRDTAGNGPAARSGSTSCGARAGCLWCSARRCRGGVVRAPPVSPGVRWFRAPGGAPRRRYPHQRVAPWMSRRHPPADPWPRDIRRRHPLRRTAGLNKAGVFRAMAPNCARAVPNSTPALREDCTSVTRWAPHGRPPMPVRS